MVGKTKSGGKPHGRSKWMTGWKRQHWKRHWWMEKAAMMIAAQPLANAVLLQVDEELPWQIAGAFGVLLQVVQRITIENDNE